MKRKDLWSMFKVGSLYAGVGGICLGFKNAGFDISWANEIDKFACITYRNNFNHQLYEEDVLTADFTKWSKIDILTAGFPCQPFSIAGYQKGFEDDRGNHFFRVMEFVDHFRPKAILLENVKNLVGHDKGNTFKVIKDSIIKRDYSFSAKVLNTKDYGNIPHNRERIFIIAFDKEMFPQAEFQYKFPKPEKLTISINDIINHGIVDSNYYYEKSKMIDILREKINRFDTVYQWRRQYVRENKSGVCPTLTANMGTGGHNVPLIKTEAGIRKLTPEECFALQGFPVNIKKFVLPSIANAHLYKQAGNSVSVPVIEKIAESIKAVLLGKAKYNDVGIPLNIDFDYMNISKSAFNAPVSK